MSRNLPFDFLQHRVPGTIANKREPDFRFDSLQFFCQVDSLEYPAAFSQGTAKHQLNKIAAWLPEKTGRQFAFIIDDGAFIFYKSQLVQVSLFGQDKVMDKGGNNHLLEPYQTGHNRSDSPGKSIGVHDISPVIFL